MKKENGFTLVELLAVIVILAVVILVAVTAVIPIMEKSRKSAFADEAMSYIKAATTANLEEQALGGAGSSCYTVAALQDGKYIEQRKANYSGYVQKDSTTGEWKVTLYNNVYYVTAASGNITRANVTKGSTTITNPTGCTASLSAD